MYHSCNKKPIKVATITYSVEYWWNNPKIIAEQIQIPIVLQSNAFSKIIHIPHWNINVSINGATTTAAKKKDMGFSNWGALFVSGIFKIISEITRIITCDKIHRINNNSHE